MSRLATERNQRALDELARTPGNDVCADCKAFSPRWASANLGIFICVRCATIHRKMGTHVSVVRSLTHDSWTKEQVAVMRRNGNLQSNLHYNPNESRHPPPTNMEESERDSELENYIRSKYEHRHFVDRSRPQSSAASASTGLVTPSQPRATSTLAAAASATSSSNSQPPSRHVAQQTATSDAVTLPSVVPPSRPTGSAATGQVWDDLLSLSPEPSQAADPSLATPSAGHLYGALAQTNSSAHGDQFLSARSPMRTASLNATLSSAGSFEQTMPALPAPPSGTAATIAPLTNMTTATSYSNPFLAQQQYAPGFHTSQSALSVAPQSHGLFQQHNPQVLPTVGSPFQQPLSYNQIAVGLTVAPQQFQPALLQQPVSSMWTVPMQQPPAQLLQPPFGHAYQQLQQLPTNPFTQSVPAAGQQSDVPGLQGQNMFPQAPWS